MGCREDGLFNRRRHGHSVHRYSGRANLGTESLKRLSEDTKCWQTGSYLRVASLTRRTTSENGSYSDAAGMFFPS